MKMTLRQHLLIKMAIMGVEEFNKTYGTTFSSYDDARKKLATLEMGKPIKHSDKVAEQE